MAAITAAIDEVNQTLPDQKISIQPDVPLYGQQGVVDSLTLTLLIVAIEQKIEESLQTSVSLVDYSTGLGEDNPFRNINTLCDYIIVLMGPKDHAS